MEPHWVKGDSITQSSIKGLYYCSTSLHVSPCDHYCQAINVSRIMQECCKCKIFVGQYFRGAGPLAECSVLKRIYSGPQRSVAGAAWVRRGHGAGTARARCGHDTGTVRPSDVV